MGQIDQAQNGNLNIAFLNKGFATTAILSQSGRMVLPQSERIGCPHRTEIRYVLTCGQLGHHYKVKLGTNLEVPSLNL